MRKLTFSGTTTLIEGKNEPGDIMRIILIAIVSLLLASTQASAWGKKNHNLTCKIAYMVMHPETKANVDALIEGNDWGVKSFEEACVWADDIRSLMRRDRSKLNTEMQKRYDIGKERGYDKTSSMHYVNPKTDHNPVNPIYCEGPCVINAVENSFKRLASNSSRAERQDALFFLAHFIGDLHQPLHVSFGHDRGGNRTYVDWFLEDQQAADLNVFLAEIEAGKRPSKRAPYCASLHAIMDTCLLEQGTLGTAYSIADNQELGELTIAVELGYSKNSITLPPLGVLWQKGTIRGSESGLKNIQPIPFNENYAEKIQEWAKKSFEFTLLESVGYCNKVDGACTAVPARLSKDAAEREQRKLKYYQDHAARLAARILYAGIHMAGFIEQAMGQN